MRRSNGCTIYMETPLISNVAEIYRIGGFVICHTHKRTEGRAPVWGSEFTSKDAALREGSAKFLLG